jgi:hypothetical protein
MHLTGGGVLLKRRMMKLFSFSALRGRDCGLSCRSLRCVLADFSKLLSCATQNKETSGHRYLVRKDAVFFAAQLGDLEEMQGFMYSECERRV